LESLITANTDFANANVTRVQFGAPFQDYERSIQITYPSTDLAEINATVFWQGRSTEQSFSLRTYYYCAK
jgi:hypothetical protein